MAPVNAARLARGPQGSEESLEGKAVLSSGQEDLEEFVIRVLHAQVEKFREGDLWMAVNLVNGEPSKLRLGLSKNL